MDWAYPWGTRGGGRLCSPAGQGVGRARSSAQLTMPTMGCCGRRQECGPGSRAAGRGGAGSGRQPLTWPGSSHFQASGGGARTTCRRVRGRGVRQGAMAC